MIDNLKRFVVLCILLIPLAMLIYLITISLDPKVGVFNTTNQSLVLSIRWVTAVKTVELEPFETYSFRHRPDSSLALYLSRDNDHIKTCGGNTDFKYSDDYDYKDDPCCLMSRVSCKYIVGLHSSGSPKVYYTDTHSKLVVEWEQK